MNDSTKQPDDKSALRPAATAIVLREHAGEIQVLMTRRHVSLAFMGGMWVFPGGALAAADQSEAARNLVLAGQSCSHKLRDLTGSALPQSMCLALAIAACRETFEETGVLLARRADGSPCSGEQLARIQAQRNALAADPMSFVTTLLAEALYLPIEHLVYWAHWITPAGPPGSSPSRRFDTRFFVAAAPDAHEHLADAYETTDCIWMSPANLLSAASRKEMSVAHPTRYVLEDLRVSIAKHGTLATLLREEANRHISAILPKLQRIDQKSVIVMPWDEDYRNTPGDSVPENQYYEPALLALKSKIERDF